MIYKYERLGRLQRIKHTMRYTFGRGNGNNHKRTRSEQSLGFDTNLRIEDYNFFQTIGEGAYCKVRIVQSQKTHQYFALKYMPKSQPASKLKTISQERNVLSRLSHPFICNLRYAFQDSQFLFMVVDLMEGGDLRYYLKRYVLTEDAIRVMIAELGCAVDYLHSNGVVHRDIKPENILLDSDGHVRLGDFNVATTLSCESPVIKGVSGTFSYLAPEMQEGSAYTELVDWWALGIVFYECVYGQPPFRVEQHDQNKMLKLMTAGAIYPETDHQVSEACIQAIQRFLELIPYDRLRDCDSMFRLEFFQCMSLESFMMGLGPSPVFVPPRRRFNVSDKVDRRWELDLDAANWKQKKKQKKQQAGHSKEDNHTDMTNKRHRRKSSAALKYKNKIRRYSEAVNRYVSTKVGRGKGSCDDDTKTTECKLKYDFDTFNHDHQKLFASAVAASPSSSSSPLGHYYYYGEDNVLSPENPGYAYSSSDSSTWNDHHRPRLPKRDSLLILSALSNPSRRKSIKRKNRTSFRVPRSSSSSSMLPQGVLAYGQAGKVARVPVF